MMMIQGGGLNQHKEVVQHSQGGALTQSKAGGAHETDVTGFSVTTQWNNSAQTIKAQFKRRRPSTKEEQAEET